MKIGYLKKVKKIDIIGGQGESFSWKKSLSLLGRVMWGVMGHLRVFPCREAADEVKE